MLNVVAMCLHWLLVAVVLIFVGVTYAKVCRARKNDPNNAVVMLGQFNAAQEAPRWFALLMSGVAVLIILFCGLFILFALYFVLKGSG